MSTTSRFTIVVLQGAAIIGMLGLLSAETVDAQVTPTVTSVSGSVLTGQTLSIAGANMVSEDKANWDSLFVNNPNASGFEGMVERGLIYDGPA